MVATTSLLDQIRGIHENRESGVLCLAKDSQRVDVFYREGLVQAASSNLETRRLGEYLMRGGYLSARDVDSVLKRAKKDQVLFGEAAVRKTLVDPADIAETVRHQSLELLQHAIKNGFSASDLSPSVRSFHTPANINFGHLFLELCRSNAASFDEDRSVLVSLGITTDLPGLPWYPEELCVLTELAEPRTVAELLAVTGIKEKNLRRVLGVFNKLGIIEVQTAAEGNAEPKLSGTAIVKRTGFPFDGVIPVVSNAVVSEKLEVLNNTSSFISEQFRNLKVRISDGETIQKVITISSPENSDGKSLVCANLAASFALELGRRVILLDCDLRNPSVHKYFGVSEQPGLVQYLTNGNLPPHCYVRKLENMFFLTSGGTAANPIELLSLRKMKELIDYLRADFDTIILDAPPFSPIADARIVTALSDGCVMVIRRGKTSYSAIEGAFRAIDRQKLLGVVFNDVKPMLFHTYYKRGLYNYGQDAQYLYPGSRRERTTPKNYLDS